MKKTTTITKIFHNNLKVSNTKSILLKPKMGIVGNNKYLPSFSKEWRNTIYSFNKNTIKNLPINDININKIIESFFNLFFKQVNVNKKKNKRLKFIKLRARRKFMRRIFVSNVEIKHTNNKAKITLYAVNREKKILLKKYKKCFKTITKMFYKNYQYIYKNYITNIHSFVNNAYKYRDDYFFTTRYITKTNYINHKLKYLNDFVKLNQLFLKKVWTIMLGKQSKKYINLLRKYNTLYSLNQYKFNKLMFLPKLSNILYKIIGKKIEYNIINIKSISYNTDLFTNILALKISKIKSGHLWKMFSIIHRAHFPIVNTIQERTKTKNFDIFQNKYRDFKIISYLKNKLNFTNFLQFINKETYNNSSRSNASSANIAYVNKIHNLIYNSIRYKNMSGIRLEVRGRLTKRYRADRAIQTVKWKGGLKNLDSSFNGRSSVLFRGNTNANVSYSFAKSKRRIGAFAVKGWIAGKY